MLYYKHNFTKSAIFMLSFTDKAVFTTGFSTIKSPGGWCIIVPTTATWIFLCYNPPVHIISYTAKLVALIEVFFLILNHVGGQENRGRFGLKVQCRYSS